MSTCSKCQGTGSQLPELLGSCRLCRGSGSRVPFPLAESPHFDKAADELDVLAFELKDADETSPYKVGYLVKTLREAAGLLRVAISEHRTLGTITRMLDKERGSAMQLQEAEELLACHTLRGAKMHRRAQRAEGELSRFRTRWRQAQAKDLEEHSEHHATIRALETTIRALEASLATVREERDQEWRKNRELQGRDKP